MLKSIWRFWFELSVSVCACLARLGERTHGAVFMGGGIALLFALQAVSIWTWAIVLMFLVATVATFFGAMLQASLSRSIHD